MFDPEFSAQHNHSPAALVVSITLAAFLVVVLIAATAIQIA